MALAGDFSEDNSPERQLARLRQIYRQQQDYTATHQQIARVLHEFDFPVIWPLFQMERRSMKLDTALL